jgi:uncharacterized protein
VAVFIVRLEHPDEAGWQRWVRPHVAWVHDQVDRGSIVASGPSVGTGVRQGWLIMRAEDEPTVRSILETDPLWVHDVVAGLQITRWDPVFGALRRISSSPDDDGATVLPTE